MKRHASILGLTAWLTLCQAAFAHPLPDLLTIYHEALQNDADFAAAQATRDAGLEAEKQAFANLLPSVSLQGSYNPYGRTEQSQTVNTLTGPREITSTSNYTAYSGAIALKQPVFRPYLWAAYGQGKAQATYAEAVFAMKQQELILRTVMAYIDLLQALKNLDLALAYRTAIGEQLNQARRLFNAGEGTITDIDEAQARYDLANAQVLEATNAIEVARYGLQRLTNKPYERVATLDAERVPLLPPDPNDIDQWNTQAISHNTAVVASRLAVEIARKEIDKNQSGHYPTVDLVASQSVSQSDSNVTIDRKFITSQVGVQIAVPLYMGGYVNSKVREAEAKLRQAQQELESAMRKASLSARQEFLNVTMGIAKVKAYRQAIVSNEHAVLSTKKGVQGGIRTNVDVLNAEQNLYTSKRDMAKALHDYLSSWVKLKGAVGALSESDIEYINQWLMRT